MAPAPPTTDRDWRGFARTLLLSMVTLFAGYVALAVLIDPYDTGRSTLLSRGAVRPQGPRTASAVRGRDPAYAGAVPATGFVQSRPFEGEPASERTEVRIVYTADTLYFGIICYTEDASGR